MNRFSLSLILIGITFLFSCSNDFLPYGNAVELKPLPKRLKPDWPTRNWGLSKPESVGFSSDKLKLVDEFAFERTGDENDRKGKRTDALLIIRNGQILYEKYARNFNESSLHLTWSVSKSIIQTLYGITIQNGLLKLDDPGYYHLETLGKDEAHKKITIRHLLTMSSGLKAEESYETGPLQSSVIAMLYTRGRANMGEFCSDLPMRSEPGTQVYYSSCDTNILSLILKKVHGQENYESLPWRELFQPLSIEKAVFERDGSGTFVGSSYLYLTARDLAKIGYLYLNNGTWEGKQLLPNNWLDFTRTPSKAYKTSNLTFEFGKDNLTSHWYANTGIPDRGIPQPWPDAPIDTFGASGHWGQMLFVIPSLDLVIVRYGDDRESKFDKNQFLKLITESVIR